MSTPKTKAITRSTIGGRAWPCLVAMAVEVAGAAAAALAGAREAGDVAGSAA